jgi:hypothetical protein
MTNLQDQAKDAYEKADAAARTPRHIAKRFGTTKTVGYIILGLAVLAIAHYVFGIF